GPARPSLLFYARRKAIQIRPGEEERMRPHLTQPGRTFILLPSRLRPQLPAEAAGFPLILERYGYALLANEPMVKAPVSSRPPKPGQTSKPDPHARFR
ncbi:MAG: hypothetical protein ACRDHG_11000, partial [Anaerolineales bacterium]